jgi:hypothetical protein
MEKLHPERDNHRIQEFPEAGVESLTHHYLCRCHTRHLSINSLYTHCGHLIEFSEFTELEGKRKLERIIFDPPNENWRIFSSSRKMSILTTGIPILSGFRRLVRLRRIKIRI